MSKAKCPLCGGTVAYQGLNSLECRTVDCDNFCGEEVDPEELTWHPGTLRITFAKPKASGFAPVPKKKAPTVGPWPSPATYKRVVKTAQQIKKAPPVFSDDAIQQAIDALKKVKIISPDKDNGTVPDLDNSREND